MSTANVEKLATSGFGTGSAQYDASRPSYTEETVEFALRETVSKDSQKHSTVKYDILELGAGTGKFTELFARRLPTNTKYLATDPSSEFLNYLKSKSLPVETSLAAANVLPLADNTVQNILCVQCFHWFANEDSLQEMHRVLVPGGKLILIWNKINFDKGWPSEIFKQRVEVFEKMGTSTKYLYHSMAWCKAIDSSPLFSINRHCSLPGIEVRQSLDQILEYVATVSAYNALPEEERTAYLNKLKKTILVWPDVNPKDMKMPYSSEVHVYTSQKKD